MAIDVSTHDGIAELVINNPPVNALNSTQWFEFAAAIEREGRRDDVNCMVIRAEGKGFQAGIGKGIKPRGKQRKVGGMKTGLQIITGSSERHAVGDPKPGGPLHPWRSRVPSQNQRMYAFQLREHFKPLRKPFTLKAAPCKKSQGRPGRDPVMGTDGQPVLLPVIQVEAGRVEPVVHHLDALRTAIGLLNISTHHSGITDNQRGLIHTSAL